MSLHVPVAPQALEGVFAFLILGAAGALGRTRDAQLLNDLGDRPRLRMDRRGAGRAAEAAVALAALVGEVERDHRDALALDVLPDVELRPVQEGVHADVRVGSRVAVELIPE